MTDHFDTGSSGNDYLVFSLLRSLAAREGLDLRQERYCELGTHHKIVGSETYSIHVGLGMSGTLVEANPTLVGQLAKGRPYDRIINSTITPDKLSDAEPQISSKAEFTESFRVSSKSCAGIEDCTEHNTTVSLTTLLANEFLDRAPLFLSLTLERSTALALESYDFRIRPYLIQIGVNENFDRDTFSLVERSLTRHDYHILMRTSESQIAVDVTRLAGHTPISSIAIGTSGVDLLLSTVKTLSLDVFDTILSRRCVRPTDVFAWMERKYNLNGFAEARKRAELNARRKHSNRGSEVSLDEIYAELFEIYRKKGSLSVLPDRISELELAAEKIFLYANPSIVELIRRARLSGRRVIAISDIYLSSNQVDGFLRAAGVTVDKVYTSSDHRANDLGKYNGKLYPFVLETEGLTPLEMVHVGDNAIADISNANAHGLCALAAKQLHRAASDQSVDIDALNEFQDTLAGSLVIGQTVRWLSRSVVKRSDVESYGYAYGGPLVMGFMLYVLKMARSEGIRRLLLLERDGHIMKAALDALGVDDIEYRTIPASRRMTIFPNADIGGFTAIASLFDGTATLTECDFFELLMIKPPDGVKVDDIMQRSPSDIFDKYDSYLRERAAQEKSLILEALAEEREMLARGDRVAWVDVGWGLSCIAGLNDMLDHSIKCFCIGSHDKARQVDHSGYLFERGRDVEVCRSIMAGTELIELLFSSTEPSSAYLERTAVGLQRVPKPKPIHERVRDAFISDVWKGTLAFIADISDLLDGLPLEEMREFNRKTLVKYCTRPHSRQYAILADIPHDPRPGNNPAWQNIRDLWKVKATSAVESAVLRHELQKARRRPFRLIRDLVLYRVLRLVSRCSPPLPERTTARFARSAAKRDPRR